MSLIARRPRLIAAAAATAVAGLALAGWTFAPRTDEEGRALGPRVAIQLVTPPEPEIAPGGVMSVGQLNDGFDDAALRRVAEVEDPTWAPDAAYAGPDYDMAYLPRMPLPASVGVEDFPPVEPPPPPRRNPLDDGSRWFGLDRLLGARPARRAELPPPPPPPPEPDWREEAYAERVPFPPPPPGPRSYYEDRYLYSSE